MANIFNKFFFTSNGTLIAVTVRVYVQDEVGQSWAYGICSVFMFIAIVIFLSRTKRYSVELLCEDTPGTSSAHHSDQFQLVPQSLISLFMTFVGHTIVSFIFDDPTFLDKPP
ncbi:hypothetical protein V6N13_125563 [Hibiscus sabdariffa]|uniref:Uncharacterized protein n=1 Tax=Hibiscus sabdariffa TaxID=183260 RepID=A0ABR2U6U0_9ROSI